MTGAAEHPAGRRPGVIRRRFRLAVLTAAVLVAIVVVAVAVSAGGSRLQAPRPHDAPGAGSGDPFAYVGSREAEFVARATAGNAQVLFTQSPGGALATAQRVATFRPAIDRATSGTTIDPNLLEALVFVESAGRPQVIAGSDPADAAGLTQILAQTGQSLLGMHINLARSRRLTAQIYGVLNGTRRGRLGVLLARRAAIDQRFNPVQALAATVRYLRFAESQFGRQDLAFESYHMGIGNLHQVLDYYDGGRPVPYAQLYFDTAPDRHRAAYQLLSGFGDDSSLYYWRLLGALQIMRLYRTDRAALAHLSGLELASDSDAQVLHPPARTGSFTDPQELAAAYRSRELVPLPANAAALGFSVSPTIGSHARNLGAPPGLYRGLRPVALRLLIALAARVRTLADGAAPLRLADAVSDARYLRLTSDSFTSAANGYSFQILRRYVNAAQREAFQAMLDRLQSLNLIAWALEPTVIDVTVASDAGQWLR
jgi:hypothetical protein